MPELKIERAPEPETPDEPPVELPVPTLDPGSVPQSPGKEEFLGGLQLSREPPALRQGNHPSSKYACLSSFG